MSSASQEKRQTMSFAEDVMKSILVPGYTAKGVIQVMFYAFYFLFATLFAMIFATGGNIHVIALLILSIALFLMIRWFMAELERVKASEQKKE